MYIVHFYTLELFTDSEIDIIDFMCTDESDDVRRILIAVP